MAAVPSESQIIVIVIFIIDILFSDIIYYFQRYKALQLAKIGFCLGQLADRCTIFSFGKRTKYRRDGSEMVDRAIEIYSKARII